MKATTPTMLKNPPPIIDTIKIPGIEGMIGITSCPGMRDDFIFDLYGESLVDDLQTIRAWGATVVVTLLEEAEMKDLGVRELGKQVIAQNMIWLHLPIRNMGLPDELSYDQWRGVVPCLCNLLSKGQRVLVHCKEGIGRAGLVAASLLVELGIPAAESIRIVRKARPGSLHLLAHEKYCHSLAMKTTVRQNAAAAPVRESKP